MSRLLGVLNPRQQATPAAELHAGRVRAARAHAHWTELDPGELVARGFRGRLRVSASTDAVFSEVRGVVFEAGSSTIVAPLAELFFVVEDDRLVFFERQAQTWSQVIARRARPRAKRRARA